MSEDVVYVAKPIYRDLKDPRDSPEDKDYEEGKENRLSMFSISPLFFGRRTESETQRLMERQNRETEQDILFRHKEPGAFAPKPMSTTEQQEKRKAEKANKSFCFFLSLFKKKKNRMERTFFCCSYDNTSCKKGCNF